MQQPWQSMMKVGIVHFMAFPETLQGGGPYLETLEKIAVDDFFTAVEIRRPTDEALAKDIKALLTSARLTAVVGAQPCLLLGELNLNALDETARAEAIDEVKKSIDFAYEVGAKIVAVLSGPDPGEERRAAGKEQLVRSLAQLCTYAQEQATDYIVTISLETFDRDVDKKCLVGPSREGAEIAAEVRESVPNFGLTVDLSHLPLLKETPTDALAAVGQYLVHAHAGNCVLRDKSHPAYGDAHPAFGIPEGENDMEELQRFLEALVYAGYFVREAPTELPVFSFEVKPIEGEKSEIVIANAKRTFKEAWARL